MAPSHDIFNPDSHRLSIAMHRAARIMIFAIPLGLAAATAVMVAGGVDLNTISMEQAACGHLWLVFHDPFNMIACGLFFVASFVCCGRRHTDGAPDPFRLARFALRFVLCAVLATLWLGAWFDPFGLMLRLMEGYSVIAASVLGVVILLVKIYLLVLVQLFAQKMLPEFGHGSLGQAGLKVLVPASVGNIVAAAAYLWLVDPLTDFQNATRMVLVVIGLMGCLCLGAYAAYAYATGRLKRRSAAVSAAQPTA